MFIGNFYIDAAIGKTLMYVTGETGESRRFHLFNIGFDHYCRDNHVGSAWCFNLTIPFASFTVGWVFKNKAA